EIMGRMMEDIVLLETTLANPRKQVFVLQFAVGEFDMVVFDPAASSCEIYEIKHRAEIVPEQARHLTDPEKCALTEHRYGPITRKTVLYRGATQDVDGIRYRNVEEYLKGVG
ncbi:MAG: ATP-binding protein, partial [Clostridia bacterium]|nr:ATP-binding protein [Clostridia bacterium]